MNTKTFSSTSLIINNLFHDILGKLYTCYMEFEQVTTRKHIGMLLAGVKGLGQGYGHEIVVNDMHNAIHQQTEDIDDNIRKLIWLKSKTLGLINIMRRINENYSTDDHAIERAIIDLYTLRRILIKHMVFRLSVFKEDAEDLTLLDICDFEVSLGERVTTIHNSYGRYSFCGCALQSLYREMNLVDTVTGFLKNNIPEQTKLFHKTWDDKVESGMVVLQGKYTISF